MNWIHAETSRVIDARPEELYAVVSDYHVGHPAIVPKAYFTELTVEEGGVGAGTIVRVRGQVFGQEFRLRQLVTEPEPGRLLVETDTETGQESSFRFEPLNGGKQTRVTIAAKFPPSPGFKGFMERLLNPPISRRMFQQELANLEDYVRSQQASPTSN